MNIMDAHCDVLEKLLSDQSLSFYDKNEKCHVSYEYMEKANVLIQIFALFVHPEIPPSQRFHYVLRMIDVFYERVVAEKKMKAIQNKQDFLEILSPLNEVRGGILSLEGADALEGQLVHLRTLYRLGVRALGFTWNYRNEAADGVEEPNPGGLSMFGRELLQESNRLGIMLDVSHLSERGFWDVMDLSNSPIIASHSNCKTILNHKRNLTDDQLKAIFSKDGVVGLTFVPYFVSDQSDVRISHLLRHLDYVLALGGEDHVGFGSDFDGIRYTMGDLQNTGCYSLLMETLLKYYKEEQVKKFLSLNWIRVFTTCMK